jgi:hypothetical protein
MHLLRSKINLYSIDTATLHVTLIGTLNIKGARPWIDANALAYNPLSDTLYTVTQYWDFDLTNNRGQLAKVNMATGELSPIGEVSGLIKALSYNERDRQLYALAVYGWNDSDKSHVIRIDPKNAQTRDLFKTPYHVIGGLAKKPNGSVYYCWVNEEGHFYAELLLHRKTILRLGNSDSVNALFAIVYKDFSIGIPRTKDQCKNGEFEAFGFKTESECARFVNTER